MVASHERRAFILERVSPGRRAGRYELLADEDLAAMVESGDSVALAVLYCRHARAAQALAYRIVGEHATAEDLVQDAFLKAWRSAGSYRVGRGSVRNWIFSIVHNHAIDHLRSVASRRRAQERIEASVTTYQQSDAFTEAWRSAQREKVREALETLPPGQLEVIEMSYYSGYTHTEISQLLGMSLGTVKSRLRLGVKKIKAHLEARDPAVAC